MNAEGLLYILRKIFAFEYVTIGDNGAVYVNQPEQFIEISDFVPCESQCCCKDALLYRC